MRKESLFEELFLLHPDDDGEQQQRTTQTDVDHSEASFAFTARFWSSLKIL
jgi:hypothetical protein